MVSRLALISCILLAGCATCPTNSWVKPIYPSKYDTIGTKKQILTHNKAWEENNEGL